MIQETIITTQNNAAEVHIAPMGIHIISPNEIVVLPFRPSKTLDNMLNTNVAVINYCDDVRIFAGCLTGRRNWPLKAAEKIMGQVLQNTLAHSEVEVIRVEDDATRPKLICKLMHTVNHRPFMGFNRAQFAVLEAAILVSRIDWLPPEKVQSEIEYCRIAITKTAGERELEAWDWLMAVFEQKMGRSFYD